MSDINNTGDSAPLLANAGVAPPTPDITSYRNALPSAATYTQSTVPALPPRPDMGHSTQNYGMNQPYSYGGVGMNSYGMGGYGSMGGYGGFGGMGGYGMGGYGGFNGGYGMGMGMNGQNPYGYGNIESRFIQIAEERSRPAFESIQSLVYAVGGVSMMLENTFFALTSSFRAILGVAENFGRLRSLFAQFWTTFGVIRSINWLIRKLAVMMGIRTEAEFKAWAEAVAETQSGTANPEQRARGSSWPVLLFFGVIAAAPYILLRMFNSVAATAETLSDPKTWKNPLRAVAQHSFQASSPQELNFNENQVLTVAPQILQGNLWNSGWLMATTDGTTPGLIPVPYIKIVIPSENNASIQSVKPPENPVQATPTVIEDL